MELQSPRVLGDDALFHPGSVAGLEFLDELRVLSWSRYEKGVRLWMIEGGPCLNALLPELHLSENALAVDPDKTLIAGAAGKEGIHLQFPGPLTGIRTVPVPDAEICCSVFLDWRRLACGDTAGRVWLIDLEGGGPPSKVPLPESPVLRAAWCLATHPTLPLLLAIRTGDGARVFDLEGAVTLRGRSGVFRRGGFLEEDEAAWLLGMGGDLYMIPLDRRPDSRPVLNALAVTPDPATGGLLAVDHEGDLTVLFANDATRPLGWKVPIDQGLTQLAITPGGQRVAFGYRSGEVVIRDRVSGEPLNPPPRLDGIRPVGFAADGRLVASLRGRRAARWDLAPDPADLERDGPVVPIRATTVATNGARIAYIETWHLHVAGWGESSPRVLGLTDGHRWIRWSPDGSRIATGGSGKSLSLWHADARGHPIHTPTGRDSRLSEWSPDGQLLAVAGRRKKVRLFEVTRLRITDSRPTCVSPLGAIAWRPDGRHLFVVGEKGGLEALDLATRVPAWTLPSHPGGRLLAISPDGRWLACGSYRHWTLYELDPSPRGPRPREVARSEDFRGLLVELAFSPDSCRLVVSDETWVVRIWRLD